MENAHDCTIPHTPGTCNICDTRRHPPTRQSVPDVKILTHPLAPGVGMGIVHTDILTTTPTSYTEADAQERVMRPRIGSLAPDQVTPAYLLKLSGELYQWHDEVQREITRRGVCFCQCECCGKDFAHEGDGLIACSPKCAIFIAETADCLLDCRCRLGFAPYGAMIHSPECEKLRAALHAQMDGR